MRAAHGSVALERQKAEFRWAGVVLRSVLRALWFVALPLLTTGLALRYVVPHSSTARGVEGALASFGNNHALLLALSLFLTLASLLRYWQTWLPGGRYLSSLPLELVERVPPQRIAACEQAAALLRSLDSRAARARVAACSPDVQTAIAAAAGELNAMLSAGKWSRVPAACSELQGLSRSVQRREELKKTLLFAALVAGAALLALQLRTRLVQTYEVIGTSMLPALTPGELLAGSLRAYGPGRLPRRGDVVVLRAVVDGREQELIKRVIGLPGDHIGLAGVHPIINGWVPPLCNVGGYYSPDDETARSGDPGGQLVMEFLEGEAYLTLQAAEAAPFQEYVVKPGEVFVMGDNRSNSRDSRSFVGGAPSGFPLSSVRAKVVRVLFERTRRGALDLSSSLRPLSAKASLFGTEMSDVEAQVKACLAIRPMLASPPSAAGAALAQGSP